MRDIILFGCKDTTLHTARFLKNLDLKIHLVTISPELATSNQVAGYENLTVNSNIFESIYVAKNYSLNEEDITAIKNCNNASLGFCIGWQRLIPKELLSMFSVGVFGMHGSARDLPFGKGRSPMNWALIEGRKLFHTNLFKYDIGIDNGPVLDSKTFSISESDTAETLHYKNTLSMCSLIKNNLESLLYGKYTTQSQSLAFGESFYPKRSPSDGIIDWRDDMYNIDRLIRAVTKPFDGAFSYINGEKVVVERAAVFYTDLESHPFLDSKFGYVLDVFPNNKFLVRCSGGVLIIHNYDGITPNIGEMFDITESPFKNFKRNVYGFFDVE